MIPYYSGDSVTLHHGSCLDVLAELPDASVDAVVTDPPYGLANTTPEKIAETVVRWVNGERDYLPGGKGFMGNPWDAFVPPAAVWDDCLRVLKPGGHVLAFAGSRTMDLMGLSLRMAGFDIRDSIAWLYGSGFPKSLDVSKAIDKARDDRDDIVRVTTWLKAEAKRRGFSRKEVDLHMETSDMAGWWMTDLRHRCQCPTWEQWDQLKRFMGLPDDMDTEVWRLNGRKGSPGEAWEQREVIGRGKAAFSADTAWSSSLASDYDITAPATPDAERWQGWGTALKPAFEPVVVARKPLAGTVAANVLAHGTGALNIDGCRIATTGNLNGGGYSGELRRKEQYSSTDSAPGAVPLSRLNRGIGEFVQPAGRWPANVALDESQAEVLGEPSRFMYVAKAPKSERPNVDGLSHPTVKPLALMRWLVRLVTPPGGTVLEPFAGSGTTIEAALLEGFNVIGVEREAEYLPLIEARIARALATDTDLFGGAA